MFAKLTFEGKVKAALRILEEDDNHAVLPMNDEVHKALKKKHPKGKKALPSALVNPNFSRSELSHFIQFDQLDGEMIQEVALKAGEQQDLQA